MPDWRYYFSLRDGKFASTLVDLSLIATAPDTERPILLGIRIKMHQPNSKGLSSEFEGTIFDKLDEALEKSIAQILNGIFVGRVTTDGWWEFYYYIESAERFAESLRDVLKKFPTYEFTHYTGPDPEWKAYKESLYPNEPKEFHQIQSRQKLEEIKASRGGNLAVALLEHEMTFKDERCRENVSSRLRLKGYSLDVSFDNRSSEQPYHLIASKINVLEFNQIMETLYELIDLASAAGGAYLHWRVANLRINNS